jgi:blue copper oxidase
VYDLTARRGFTEFFAGLPAPTLGYNGNLLGPVLRMRRGERVRLNVTNRLGEPTTCHCHGLHLPAIADGGPHQVIRPGATWQASFTVKNEAATYWYHPHLEGHTGEQVYRGLAGVIMVDDPSHDALPLPRRYGVDDIPLVIQDRRFDSEGRLSYLQSPMDVMRGMLGNRVLVNGALSATMRVPAQLVRLRILNGSNARVYNLGLSDSRPFAVIASDGGMLPVPVSRQRLRMANGERFEIVVDLSSDAGRTLRLMNFNSGRAGFPLLDIFVDPDVDTAPVELPQVLAAAPHIDEAAVSRSRPFVLGMGPGMMGGGVMSGEMMGGGGPGGGMGGGPGGGQGGGSGNGPGGPGPVPLPIPGAFTINGVSMDMAVINETVRLGAVEEWRISNHTPMGHPFHVHDVQFLVRARNGALPPAHERGWKDTIYLRPGETASVLMHFTDYADRVHPYMYHCHILEHEDRGMMGQFVVAGSD